MKDCWLLIFDFLGAVSIVMAVFSFIALKLTLDRKVIKSLPHGREYSNPLDWYFGFMRVMAFAYALTSNWVNVRLKKNYYPEVEVKNIASLFDKVLAYVFTISIILMFSSMLFFMVTKYFGVLDWPDSGAL